MAQWLRPLAAGAKGPGFDSPITHHLQRIISQVFKYGTIGLLVWSYSSVNFELCAVIFSCIHDKLAII